MAVYFYGCVSLDGYLATSDHDLSWLCETGAVEDTGYDDFYARMDITLMGRRTFTEVVCALSPGAVPGWHYERQKCAPNCQRLAPVMPARIR